MFIDSNQLNHWINYFYGFGSWQAKFWFIPYEDGGGELPEEVAVKLNYFFNRHPDQRPSLADLREMYKQVDIQLEGPRAGLYNNLYDFRFGGNAVQHGIWKNLIAFVHGFTNQKLPDLMAYQKSTFAISKEALIPLYPLPSPHNHAWYYSWLDMPQFPFLKKRKAYEEHVFQGRIQTILQQLIKQKPSVVLLYGMDNISALKTAIHDVFSEAKFEMIKATKQVIPQHHRVQLGNTLMIITTQIPTLRHNRIETGFNWEEFGKRSSDGI